MSRTRVELFQFASVSLLIFLFDDKLLQDEVVKVSPPARAIRDVEDEELRSFFSGMAPWQVKTSQKLMVDFFLPHHWNNAKENIYSFELNMLQFILIVAASSVGEELFYRAAVQVSFYMSFGWLRAYLHRSHE